MSQITATDGRDDQPTFIHSELDDFGLDPFAFRVYAHLARRAGGKTDVHWASVASTARVCGMSERRVRMALRDLEEHGLVTRTERPGETSEYRLTPRRSWRGGAKHEKPRHQVPPLNTPTPAPGAAPPRHHMPTTPAPGAAKGTPTKVLPLKEEAHARKRASPKFDPLKTELPKHVDPTTWAAFVTHRREIRKPLTPTATERLVAMLRRHPTDANAMLDRSTQNGWTGVFPPDNGAPSRRGPSPRPRDDFSPDRYQPTDIGDLLTPTKGSSA